MSERDVRFWDRTAANYAKSKIADMAGYERTLERTRAHLRAGDHVFEFGCGTGSTAVRLAPHVARYVASDISGEMIEIARAKAAEAGAAITFEVAAPDTMSGADASFDAALGFNILHLIDDRRAALAAVARLLKPGGLLITKTVCLKAMNPLIRFALPAARAGSGAVRRDPRRRRRRARDRGGGVHDCRARLSRIKQERPAPVLRGEEGGMKPPARGQRAAFSRAPDQLHGIDDGSIVIRKSPRRFKLLNA
jgi:SAM-dependent methyltransferase